MSWPNQKALPRWWADASTTNPERNKPFKILFESVKERERQRFFICSFTLEMSTTARSASGRRQEVGTPSGSPTWLIGAHVFGSSFADFPGTLAGSRVGSKATKSQTRALPWVPHHKQQFNPLYYNISPKPLFFVNYLVWHWVIHVLVCIMFIRSEGAKDKSGIPPSQKTKHFWGRTLLWILKNNLFRQKLGEKSF